MKDEYDVGLKDEYGTDDYTETTQAPLSRDGDEVWDVPVVVYCVLTVVLMISSFILLSCLKRETKKFRKKIANPDKTERLEDMDRLATLLSRYVRSKLGLGVLASLANSFDDQKNSNQDLRLEIESWFHGTRETLQQRGCSDKQIKRIVLSNLRSGLQRHPLDLRGSRLALEGARIFLAGADTNLKTTFLSVSIPNQIDQAEGERTVCPTIFCDWVAAFSLKSLSLLISHPNTTPLLFVLLSFTVWLFDTISDLAIIDKLWNFNLPILYPNTEAGGAVTSYLSYQTLTIDLYAPLLLLVLVFSLVFTLLSCSCSRLSEKYRIARDYVRPENEVPGLQDQDPTALLARYDFNIWSSVSSSLPQFSLQFAAYIIILYMLHTLKVILYSLSLSLRQFSLQFAAYIIILYMLHTLKGMSVDQATKDQIAEKVNEFSFASLWLSGVGSGLALIVAQYTAFKIQHEHGLTLSQRCLYLVACVFNTISMMCSTLMVVVVVLIPAATYVGRYHIMAILILGAAMLGIGLLISVCLAGFGLDATGIQTDRVQTSVRVEGTLTSYLRFSQTAEGKWRIILGATTLIGRLFSLLTINLFLPPSQLLIHPFIRFYSTSPRSPALHYTIAKQIIYYNILMLLAAIMLCVDIDQYGFNYNITATTRNLLIYANVCGAPCLFMALVLLFKYYSTFDLWSANGVHLVYIQDGTEADDAGGVDGLGDETTYTVLEDTLVLPEDELLHSQQKLGDSEDGQDQEQEAVENESVEADRINVVKKHSKVLLKKQKARLRNNCLHCITDIAVVDTRGRWVDISDLPLT